MAGTMIVTAALISYTIAIINEQRKHRVTNRVLTFLTLGVVLDITATICMIMGSTNTPFSFHGFLGYSALAAMLTDAILLWRFRLKKGDPQEVTRSLHLYSRLAYSWWVIAYITGGLIVFLK